MKAHETIECLKLLLDSVVLDKGDPKFTILNDVKPSSFKWVIQEAMYYLYKFDDNEK